MKQLFSILFFLFCLSLFSQEIIVSNEHMLYAGDKVFIKTIITDEGSYIVDFGNDSQEVANKDKDWFNTNYLTSGSYVARLYKIVNGVQKIVAIADIKIKEKPRFIFLVSVNVQAYSPIKSSGKAWDNTFGGIYPDIYFTINRLKNGGEIVSSDIFPRVSQEMLPKDLVKSPIKIPILYMEQGVRVDFWDEDSVTNHDYMMGWELPAYSFQDIQNLTLTGLLLEADGYKVLLKFDFLEGQN